MSKRMYTPEQIINKLREVEVFIGQGATAGEASRKVDITQQTIPVSVRLFNTRLTD